MHLDQDIDQQGFIWTR